MQRGETRDSVDRRWWRFFAELTPNAVCFGAPNEPRMAERLLRTVPVTALILTGGDDLGSDPDRDAAEERLFHSAVACGVPIVGICRGLQLIQTIFGGPLERCDPDRHCGTPHEVGPTNASHDFADILRAMENVNSYHRNGVAASQIAQPLTPLLVAYDGIVEAAYAPQPRVLALQWHPERYSKARDTDLAIFERFLGFDRTARRQVNA